MGLTRTALALDALSGLCVAVAVASVLFARGAEQRVLTTVAGAFLVLCTVTAGRITDAENPAPLNAAEDGGPVLRRARDVLALTGIGSALVGGWLIYSAADTLPYKRIYLVASLLVVASCIAASRALDHLARRGAFTPK
jgi:hypothetical protein